jgi:hypothetical protein
VKRRLECFDVPIEKLLQGGENGIRAARYAELTHDFLRPSTPVAKGPHVEFLREYDRIGDKILAPGIFEKTRYFRNAEQCVKLTGAYFVHDRSDLRAAAESFLRRYRGEEDSWAFPGRSDPNESIWIRPIRHSTYFEVIDGNHRIARAISAGKRSVAAWVSENDPALTPLQSLLLDVLWIKGRREIYQPLEYPEIQESWKTVRKCGDRLTRMKTFLSRADILKRPNRTYLDIGSSYGWFVKQFEELGFQSRGVERDSIASAVGMHCYGIRPDQIRPGDIGRVLRSENGRYDVVTLLSVLHHYALGKNVMSAEELIRLVDRVTGSVLLFDTGEAAEGQFAASLSKWTVPFIADWLKKHTSFTKIIPLGKDEDRVPPFHRNYARTLFACVRD